MVSGYPAAGRLPTGGQRNAERGVRNAERKKGDRSVLLVPRSPFRVPRSLSAALLGQVDDDLVVGAFHLAVDPRVALAELALEEVLAGERVDVGDDHAILAGRDAFAHAAGQLEGAVGLDLCLLASLDKDVAQIGR